MGNNCSNPCSKPKSSQSFQSSKNSLSLNSVQSQSSLRSTPRETINQFSLTNFKLVQQLANQNKISSIKGFLDQGFLVDFPLDQSGWTLLHLSCQQNNLELVEFLLKYKPYLDAQELAEGWTPLMVCAINDFEEIARLLILKGADKEILDKSSKTAKELAVKYKSFKFLKII